MTDELTPTNPSNYQPPLTSGWTGEPDEDVEIFTSGAFKLGQDLGAYDEREKAVAAFREGRFEEWIADTEPKSWEDWDKWFEEEKPKRLRKLALEVAQQVKERTGEYLTEDELFFLQVGIAVGDSGFVPAPLKDGEEGKELPLDYDEMFNEMTDVKEI